MRKTILTILFIICIASTSYTYDKDSVDNVLNKLPDDSNKVMVLLKAANGINTPLIDNINYSNDAFNLANKINYNRGKLEALNSLGKANNRIGDYELNIKYLFEELRLSSEFFPGDSSLQAGIYLSIGEAYRAVGNYDLAKEYLSKSNVIYRLVNDSLGIAKSHDRLAAVYFELYFRDKSEDNLIKTFDNVNKSFEIANIIGNNDLIIGYYNILGATYSVIGNLNMALDYLFNAVTVADSTKGYLDMSNLMNNICGVYYLMENYKDAEFYGKKSFEIGKKDNVKIYILESAKNLSHIYYKTGKYKDAFDYLEIVFQTNMEMFGEKKMASIYSLNKTYEQELKDQKSKAEKRIITLIVIFSAVFLIAGIIALILKNRHQKVINIKLEARNKLIQEQKEQLTQLISTKDKFFSILSHDLRNPLSAIIGFATILRDDFNEFSDFKKEELLNHILSSSNGIDSLISKVLIWSRLQSGKINIQPVSTDVLSIIENVLELQNINAKRKEISLANTIRKPINVFADGFVIETVLRNLVDNAIKFTKRKGVILIEGNIFDGKLELGVKDDGVGIAESDLQKILDKRDMFHTVGTNNESGTGLGLSVCMEMLALSNSKLLIETEPGKGSRFYFYLPLSKD